MLLPLVAVVCVSLTQAAPFSGSMTAVNGNHRRTYNIPQQTFTGSLGETIVADPSHSKMNSLITDMNMNGGHHSMDNNHNNDGVLVRRRRLADDKRLDLKMKMQRVKKVVSMDAIGSYSIFRSDDRKTSLKAFGSTEVWYDGTNFGFKKPGLGVQFTIYY